MQKISIKEAMEQAGTSRTTLYRYLKKLRIKPFKIKGVSYISEKNLSLIISKITGETPKPSEKNKSEKTQVTQPDTSVGQGGTSAAQPDTTVAQVADEIKKIFTNEIAELKAELKEERAEKKELLIRVGKAEGEVQLYKESFLRLEAQREEEPQESKIISAEIIENSPSNKANFFKNPVQWVKERL